MVTLGFLLAAIDNRPKRPTFIRCPYVLTESEPIRVEVRITPHPDIRTVILELWEAVPDSSPFPDALEELPTTYHLGHLIRSSIEPVDETNPRQQVFRFAWGPQREGTYAVVARVGVRRGLTLLAPTQILEIR